MACFLQTEIYLFLYKMYPQAPKEVEVLYFLWKKKYYFSKKQAHSLEKSAFPCSREKLFQTQAQMNLKK